MVNTISNKIVRRSTLVSILGIAALTAAIHSYAQGPLPVKSVTLFSSGVSYTERGGIIDGTSAIPLTFRIGQINDILKSMVLLDQTGKVQPITFGTRDPIGHTLQTFAVDVTGSTSMESILGQLRGAKVSVDTPGKSSVVGQIVGIESRQVAGEDTKAVTATFLTLLTDTGLVSIKLDTDKSVRLLDERLNKEFKEALGVLASRSDDQRRQVTLHFAGNGSRQVRVGYVTEAPLWKMSYRLVVGDGTNKPYLQGWAMVENTSDEDWKDIQLTLISGRPISFIQDLYQPLYIPRPIVPNDVIASPTPQTHAGSITENEKLVLAKSNQDAKLPALSTSVTMGRRDAGAAGPAGGGRGFGIGGGGFGGGGQGGGLGGNADAFDAAPSIYGGAYLGRGANTPLSSNAATMGRRTMGESIDAMAAGQKAGELFQYNITTPVNLQRQQAAMIPVVSKDVTIDKLSLFSSSNNSEFPLNAIRLNNSTGLHLKGGPITLFDQETYAGDAKMEDIPPGDSRLITYAVDLNVHVAHKGENITYSQATFVVKHGIMISARKLMSDVTYEVKSTGDKTKTVLIEHPYNPAFELIAPAKSAERTANLYRFEIKVEPGKTETLKVTTSRPLVQEIRVIDADINAITAYVEGKELSPKVKAALIQVVQMRREATALRDQAAAKDKEIESINSDQDRIRKNMEALDKASALYKRYVGTLDAQETKIGSLRMEAANLRKLSDDANKALRIYVDGLDVEN